MVHLEPIRPTGHLINHPDALGPGDLDPAAASDAHPLAPMPYSDLVDAALGLDPHLSPHPSFHLDLFLCLYLGLYLYLWGIPSLGLSSAWVA